MKLKLFTALCFGMVTLGLTRGDLSRSRWPETNKKFRRCAHHEHNFEITDSKNEHFDSNLPTYQTTAASVAEDTTFGISLSSMNQEDKKIELTTKNQNNALLPDRQKSTNRPSVARFFPQSIPFGILLPLKLQDYTTNTVPILEDKTEVSNQSSLTRPEGNRPPFAGQSGGNFYPQLIPPGTPWPPKPQDYTNSTKIPVVEDRIEGSTDSSLNRPEGNRPPFAGQSGGNFYPQLIPPGTPWPPKPQDYTNSTKIPAVEDRIEGNTERSTNRPEGNRPPFAGQSGGNFYPQLIPPGTSWPPKPQDYTNSTKIPVLGDRIEGSTDSSLNRPEGNRPPFAGQSGGNFYPQLIPPGTPWPSKPEDYMNSTKIPVVEDRIEGSTESSTNRPEGNMPPFAGQSGGNFYPQLIPPGTLWLPKPQDYTNSTKIPVVEDRVEGSTDSSFNRPEGNRPPFAGQSGGNFYPQLIPPGTPWPPKPQDSTNSTKIPVVEDRIEGSTESFTNRPEGNRPPFAGQSGGNFYPQLIPPGTPWPSKPENYTNSTRIPVVEDRIEGSTESSTNRPEGNRPPFAGQSGGNFYPQLIPPGTPWPSKPENSTKIPVIEDIIEGSTESSTNRPEGNRPPFAGQSGGNFYPQLIPSGTPWPSKPDNHTNSTKNPVLGDRFEVSIESSSYRPIDHRLTSTQIPLSEGSTEVSNNPHITNLSGNKTNFPIRNGGDHSQSAGATQPNKLPEGSNETPYNRQLGNRPPFSGQSGGHFNPQLIPAGTPWPSKPENFATAPNFELQDKIEDSSKTPTDRSTSTGGETTSKDRIDVTTVTKQYFSFLGDRVGFNGHFKPSPVVESPNVFIPQIIDPDMLILEFAKD